MSFTSSSSSSMTAVLWRIEQRLIGRLEDEEDESCGVFIRKTRTTLMTRRGLKPAILTLPPMGTSPQRILMVPVEGK